MQYVAVNITTRLFLVFRFWFSLSKTCLILLCNAPCCCDLSMCFGIGCGVFVWTCDSDNVGKINSAVVYSQNIYILLVNTDYRL